MPAGVVSQTTLRLLAAELGPESPLPPFAGLQKLPDPSSSPDLPPDMRERIAYGRLANPLPYALQNAYRRDLRPQEIPRNPDDQRSAGGASASGPRGPALVAARPGGRPGSGVHQPAPAVRQLRASPTPGSPAASSGTSAPPATRPRRADRSSPAACRPTVEPHCGSGSGSAPEISCSRSTC